MVAWIRVTLKRCFFLGTCHSSVPPPPAASRPHIQRGFLEGFTTWQVVRVSPRPRCSFLPSKAYSDMSLRASPSSHPEVSRARATLGASWASAVRQSPPPTLGPDTP